MGGSQWTPHCKAHNAFEIRNLRRHTMIHRDRADGYVERHICKSAQSWPIYYIVYNAYFPIYHLTINDKQSRRRKSRTHKRRRLSLGCYSTLFEDAIGNIENIDNSLLQRPQSSPKRKLKGEAIKDLMSSLNSSTSSLSSTAEQPREGKKIHRKGRSLAKTSLEQFGPFFWTLALKMRTAKILQQRREAIKSCYSEDSSHSRLSATHTQTHFVDTHCYNVKSLTSS